jgi:uncharacterized membrane protein
MPRLPLNDLRLEPARFTRWPEVLSRISFCLFLAQAAMVAWRSWQPAPWFPQARWPEGVLLLLATTTVLTALARSLPFQNLFGAGAIIGIISGGAHLLGATAAIPFGPYSYTRNAGQDLIYPLPGSIPVLWVLIVLTSRGAARSVMRRWRTTPNYGYWLISLTLVLILWIDLSLEPFATVIHKYWIWAPTKMPLTWFGAPLVNFLGWLLTGSLIVGFVTPFLLRKNPVPAPPEYLSVTVWCVLQLVLANACAAHQLWAAAEVGVGGAATVGFFAWWSWQSTGRKRDLPIR